MRALGTIARPVERRSRAIVFCPHCFIECAVSAGRSLTGVACVRCLGSLAPDPASERHPPALREAADWWDSSQAGGPGYAAVACPCCHTLCVVAVGQRLSGIGCGHCLRPLGPGPLLRYELAPSVIEESTRRYRFSRAA